MNRVTVVGAGFSGLSLAFYLNELGVPVQVVERAEKPGGLISTHSTEHGLVETAANALILDEEVERVFARIKVDFAPRLKSRRKRFVFWKRPRRWPVSLLTTIRMFKLIFKPRPRALESVADWGTRAVDAQFTERLLAPALQGIYAGDARRMSATLTLGRMLSKKRRKSKGSAAPAHGMGTMIEGFAKHLQAQGVEIRYGEDYKLPAQLIKPVVICTSAWTAAEIVESAKPDLALTLRRCESLPLATVTAFYAKVKALRGFGCLFPAAQNFTALGVLFNDCVFAGRSSVRSETWILGGTARPDITNWSDAQILEALRTDRRHMLRRDEEPLATHITRWPRALPHYTLDWESTLSELTVERPLFLHGNYLGALGLASILERSQMLAQEIRELYAD